jgi:sugar-specific transcriptional regulator TrmB
MLQTLSSQEEVLAKVLPKEEAAVYLYLLNKAPRKASEAAKDLMIARPIVYKLLERLIEKDLVVKHKKHGDVAVYNPQHPANLKAYVDTKVREVESHQAVFDASLPSLISEFHTRFGGIPGFRVIMGVEGVHELYEDILNERKDIMLIRSPQDHSTSELRALVLQQIERQVAQGIHTRAIVPLRPVIEWDILGADKKNLVERRIVPEGELAIPAQIIIYANKVGITAYGNTLMTTIIENTAIRNTFEILFNYIWKKAEADHKEILSSDLAE